MTDESKTKTRWTDDPSVWPSFWAYAKVDLGLTETEVHLELGYESVKDYGGTKEQAIKILEAAAARKLYEAVRVLPEPPMLIFADFISPAGRKWAYTFRVGLPPYLRALALEQVRDAVRDFEAMAETEGWLVPGALNGAPARQLVAADGPDPAGPRGDPGIPPPPPPTTGTTPPVPTGPMTSPIPQDDEFANRLILDTAFVKITAPTGKPRIEFWNPNRQYPEIYWALSAEAFLEQVASGLEAKGWTVEHFKQVGEQYTIPLRIEWVVSPKNEKWKDIIAVWLRQ